MCITFEIFRPLPIQFRSTEIGYNTISVRKSPVL